MYSAFRARPQALPAARATPGRQYLIRRDLPLGVRENSCCVLAKPFESLAAYLELFAHASHDVQ